MITTIVLTVAIVAINRNKNNHMRKLRIAWYSSNKLETHDTANIQFAASANVLRNIYSPLMIYNSSSEIEFVLIQDFSWISETEIKFQFKENLKSSNGDLITAEDAYLTLKRLIIKQTNTHGNLQNFLCPSDDLKSVSDVCSGLRYEGNALFLKADNKDMAKFLLPLVTNMDFGVIPKNAIDWATEDLIIKDYSNTSGPYFVESTNEHNEHSLAANRNSPLYHEEMPQLVVLIPVMDTSSPEKIRNNEIDMISTVDKADIDIINNFELDKNFTIHKTSELKVTALYFTSAGLSKTKASERLLIGKIIKSGIIKEWPEKTVLKVADQFFPTFGEASLSKSQFHSLAKKVESAENIKTSQKLKISVEAHKLEMFKMLFAKHENLEFIKFSGMPNSKKPEEMEDAFILPGDTGFYENISLISYYMSTGTFGYNKADANKWIQDYIKIDDKVTRLDKLRELHFDVLSKGLIIPISITPYIAVAKKEWKIEFYKHFAGTPIWMMRKN